MALSALKKYNTENAPYSYKSAILLEALYRAYKVLKDESILGFVKDMLDYYVPQDGVIRTYDLEAYSMDQVRMGNIMLSILGLTGEKKYKTAVDMFMRQLETQPRTPSGGFWHKGGYPNQMWLDGLYMQAPFRVDYCKRFGGLKDCLDDTIKQFELVYDKTLDTRTGLLRHAWDESCKMPWCESDGRSQEVWARALGWYVMALADLLEIVPTLPEFEDHRARFVSIAKKLAPAIVKFQDRDSGMWWQVMDKAGQGANYLETSATSMFVYFFAKMHRLGFFDDSYLEAAKRGFAGMISRDVTVADDGELSLHDTCKSAGLGVAPEGTVYRPADFKYYTEGEEKVTDNLHGVSPFISAAVELEFPAQLNQARYTLKEDDDQIGRAHV